MGNPQSSLRMIFWINQIVFFKLIGTQPLFLFESVGFCKGMTAIRAGQLEAVHGDPADRMIVAAATESSAEMTADQKTLSWNRYKHAIDARL